MLYYCNARNIPDNAAEVWFVVRSLQIYHPVKGVKYRHVNTLSPNLELFKWARKKIDNNDWGIKEYEKYEDDFARQLLSDAGALKLITYLRGIMKDNNKNIWLACYCVNFERCHLKILKKIIEKPECKRTDCI